MNRIWRVYLGRVLWIALAAVVIDCGYAAWMLNAEAAPAPKVPIVCAPKTPKAIISLTPAERSAWRAERRQAETAKGGKKPKAQRERIKR